MLKSSICLILIILALTVYVNAQVITPDIPKTAAADIAPYAKFNFDQISESSGLVKSRIWKNVYWTHNDSGDGPRIFPVTRDGKIIKPRWSKDWYRGIEIPDAVHVDWEDIAADNDGFLYIAAFGNNDNIRRDLAVYVIKDCYPEETVLTSVFKKINFHYPEQTEFPPKNNNFDAEALFWADGKLYLLTKHRADNNTCLYRFDSTEPFVDNPLTKISEFAIGGQVTGADCSPDEKKLAVLTRKSVWLFELTGDSDNYFNGKTSYLPVSLDQCEAICLDSESMIIANEEGNLYQIPIADLIPLK